MLKLYEVTRPGIMISQVAPKSREQEGETVRVLEHVLKQDFFTSVQTVDIPFLKERREFAEFIHNDKLLYVYCLARIQNQNKLNLSDLNASNRSKSVEIVIHSLYDAKEAGADSASLISGPRPSDANLRNEALKKLEQSLFDICSEAAKLSITVEIEPLDYAAHKMNTLGSTQEAVALCQSLLSHGQELYLCLDTAHMLLNGEQPFESLKKAIPFTKQYHFCNCVLEQSHSQFGDLHLPFGDPGVMDEKGIGLLMKEALSCGFFNTKSKPGVMCEVLNNTGANPIQLITETRFLMERAWEMGRWSAHLKGAWEK